MSVRSSFLELLPAVRAILADDAVARAWEEPSALEQMTVGMVAGHLLRAVVTLDRYIGGGEPELTDKLTDAAGYLLSMDDLVVPGSPDLDAPLHREVRGRSLEAAQGGHDAVIATWDETVRRLSARLTSEPAARRVTVLGNVVMLLDEYITTRLIELVVHADDLAVSVGLDPLTIPSPAYRAISTALFNTAHRRHGSLAVIRALTRRERDIIEALRVF